MQVNIPVTCILWLDEFCDIALSILKVFCLAQHTWKLFLERDTPHIFGTTTMHMSTMRASIFLKRYVTIPYFGMPTSFEGDCNKNPCQRGCSLNLLPEQKLNKNGHQQIPAFENRNMSDLCKVHHFLGDQFKAKTIWANYEYYIS